MKKIIIVILLALLIGASFAVYMFSNINKTVENVMSHQEDVYAFQVGVFSIYENAQNTASKYSNSYIYKDKDKYRVFIAIYQDQEIIEYMKNYYYSNDTTVYLKKLEVSSEFQEQLNKYETLLKKTSNKETYISANKNILGAFEKTL